MVNKCVYLAGPIDGLSYEQATGWRDKVREELLAVGIKALSPLRADVYIASPDGNKAMSNPRGITTRDRFDCQNCSVVLVNLLGAKKCSIGTVMEIAWADLKRIPTVLVIEDNDNLHDHPMIRECIGFRVPTITAGVDIVKAILENY